MESMKKNLAKLVSFKTVSKDKKENKKALEWVKSQIPVGFKKKLVCYGGHYSLIVGNNNPLLCLQAHIDVVPANEEEFKLQEKGDRFYGRGVFDMKFAIACYLEILKKIDPKKESVGLLITSDEEFGGFNGVKKILENGYSPKFCFLPDGGDNWNFNEKSKGVWHLKIKAEGSPGHASRPWEGVSANSILIDFLADLKKTFPKIEKEAFLPTLNIGKIDGGEATNQIAENAKARIDIRFTEVKEKKKIEKEINTLQKRYKKVKVEELVYASPFSCDVNEENFKLFKKIAKKHGKKVSSQFTHGASDARFFGEKNIPTILIRPKGGGAHAKKEWTHKKDLAVFCSVLEKFVKEVGVKN